MPLSKNAKDAVLKKKVGCMVFVWYLIISFLYLVRAKAERLIQ